MMWTTRQRSDIGGLSAITCGDGPGQVLLLHGVGLRAEAWNAQIDALSGQARVIAPDMPGHGNSPAPDRHMALSDYTTLITGILDMCDGPVVAIGHSMGAMVALDLAARWPERISGVAALNAVFERDADAARAVQNRAAALDGLSPANPEPTLARWFGAASSPERDACRNWLRTVDPRAYRQAYTAFAQSGTPDRAMLARLACPALFMTGSAEPNSTPTMSRAMAEIAPLGRAVVVTGAAHMMPMTHADAVNRQLQSFLEECTHARA